MDSKNQISFGFQTLEQQCREFIEGVLSEVDDSAHDLNHMLRVVKNAKLILEQEEADAEIVIAAAWLHDCVIIPKNHPDRKRASTLAAEKAGNFLKGIEFPKEKTDATKHVIETHSFSAGISPQSIEAKIVQDADRLDAIGAIGIARCFMVGGKLDRLLYNEDDPFCEKRDPDDTIWTIDHFYKKLFKLPEMMHTEAAKKEGYVRVRFMEEYLMKLKREI